MTALLNQEEGLGQNEIACEDGGVVAVRRPRARLRATGLNLVDHVVVEKRGEVDQFHGGGEIDRARVDFLYPSPVGKGGAKYHQRGAEPLAPILEALRRDSRLANGRGLDDLEDARVAAIDDR
jgi:hypothetical protein